MGRIKNSVVFVCLLFQHLNQVLLFFHQLKNDVRHFPRHNNSLFMLFPKEFVKHGLIAGGMNDDIRFCCM